MRGRHWLQDKEWCVSFNILGEEMNWMMKAEVCRIPQ